MTPPPPRLEPVVEVSPLVIVEVLLDASEPTLIIKCVLRELAPEEKAPEA